MQTHALNVELRNERGKNENNRLRMKGYIPAILYSHGQTEAIKLQKVNFSRLFKGAISESVLIDIKITDKNQDADHKVFIKDYQVDPLTDEVLHIDFYKVRLDEKIHTKVGIEILGKSAGVRLGGILDFVERELEVECLPQELPEKIQVDVTNLQIGESIHVRDIAASGTLKYLTDPDKVIVTILLPHKAEEAVVEAAEGEVAPVEGEAADGEASKEKDKEK
jgi:large subunit ribosomal protein L25